MQTCGSNQENGQARSKSSGSTLRTFQTLSSSILRIHSTRTSQLVRAETAKRSTPKPARECWQSSKASDRPRDFTMTSNTMMTKRNSGRKELPKRTSSLSEMKRRYRCRPIVRTTPRTQRRSSLGPDQISSFPNRRQTMRELRTRSKCTRRMAHWSDSFLLLRLAKIKMKNYHSRDIRTILVNRQLASILNPSDLLSSLLQSAACLWVLRGLVTLITDLRWPTAPTTLKTSSTRPSSGKTSRLASHCLQTSAATEKGNSQINPT